MRIRLAMASLATGLLCALAPSASRADLAPPPGYVEKCTLARQAKPADECHLCAAFHGNHQHCSDSLKEYGFAERCRTSGASVWSEVWCRTRGAAAPVVPAEVLAQLGDATAVRGRGAQPPGVESAAAPQVPAPVPAASVSTVASAAPEAPGTSGAAPPATAPGPVQPKPTTGCGGCATAAGAGAGARLIAAAALLMAAATLARRRARKTP